MGTASCWASAMAMVVGWDDKVSIDPATLEKRATNIADRNSLASAWNLTLEPAASYGTPGAVHRTLRSVMDSRETGQRCARIRYDRDVRRWVAPTGTMVCIRDPWPRLAGSPHAGQQGLAKLGSEYTITYREFAGQYDPRGLTMAPDATHADIQLMHSMDVDGHAPGTIGCDAVPLTGQKDGAMNGTTVARASSVESRQTGSGLPPPPPPRARAMMGPVVGAIVAKLGADAIKYVIGEKGSITEARENGAEQQIDGTVAAR